MPSTGWKNTGNKMLDRMFGSYGAGYSGNVILDYSNPELEAQLRSQGYGDLVDANPWKNLNYHKSGWQGFLGSLGFRTGADTAIENQQFQSNEYLSKLQQFAFENQYNSEQEKADRMRSAGLNVDLQGLGDASESSGLSEDTNNVLPNGDEQDIPAQVANYVMTGITTAMGLAQNVGALAQVRTAVQSGKIANAKNIMDFATNAVLNATPNEMPTDDDAYANMINSTATNVLSSYSDLLGRRGSKAFKKAVSSVINGLPTDRKRYEEWRDRMKNRQDAARIVSSDLYSETDEVLIGISEILNKYSDKAYRQQTENAASGAELENTQIENAQKFADNIDPVLAAGTENAVNRKTLQENTFETDLNSVMADITHYLKEKADKGSWISSAALVVFSLMRMMSISRSSSTSTGPKGVTSSSGFNIGF